MELPALLEVPGEYPQGLEDGILLVLLHDVGIDADRYIACQLPTVVDQLQA
jgi:hypothetical protein